MKRKIVNSRVHLCLFAKIDIEEHTEIRCVIYKFFSLYWKFFNHKKEGVIRLALKKMLICRNRTDPSQNLPTQKVLLWCKISSKKFNPVFNFSWARIWNLENTEVEPSAVLTFNYLWQKFQIFINKIIFFLLPKPSVRWRQINVFFSGWGKLFQGEKLDRS